MSRSVSSQATRSPSTTMFPIDNSGLNPENVSSKSIAGSAVPPNRSVPLVAASIWIGQVGSRYRAWMTSDVASETCIPFRSPSTATSRRPDSLWGLQLRGRVLRCYPNQVEPLRRADRSRPTRDDRHYILLNCLISHTTSFPSREMKRPGWSRLRGSAQVRQGRTHGRRDSGRTTTRQRTGRAAGGVGPHDHARCGRRCRRPECPGYPVRGPHGGIAPLPGFRTDVTGLTADEARAMFVLLSGSAHADLWAVRLRTAQGHGRAA